MDDEQLEKLAVEAAKRCSDALQQCKVTDSFFVDGLWEKTVAGPIRDALQRAHELGIHGVIYIRCIKNGHHLRAQLNKNAYGDAECGYCIKEEADAKITFLKTSIRVMEEDLKAGVAVLEDRHKTLDWRIGKALTFLRAALEQKEGM